MCGVTNHCLYNISYNYSRVHNQFIKKQTYIYSYYSAKTDQLIFSWSVITLNNDVFLVLYITNPDDKIVGLYIYTSVDIVICMALQHTVSLPIISLNH